VTIVPADNQCDCSVLGPGPDGIKLQPGSLPDGNYQLHPPGCTGAVWLSMLMALCSRSVYCLAKLQPGFKGARHLHVTV